MKSHLRMESSLHRYRGILHPAAGIGKFRLERYWPSADVGYFVERYWIVRWNLPEGEEHLQETLPNPCVNLVVERGRSAVYGVAPGRTARLLKGEGCAFGVKFRPGGFYPFLKAPVTALRQRPLPLEDLFGPSALELEEELLSLEDGAAMVERAEAFLRHRMPERDERVEWVNRVVDAIVEDPAGVNVEDLAAGFGVSPRTLQRVFRTYVGAGPKWVIMRFRLQEAVAQLDSGHRDWTRLAADLGYFDQAHFVREFKALVGKTPTEYVRAKWTPSAAEEKEMASARRIYGATGKTRRNPT